MSSQLRDPEVLLETMFLIRHELITARTTAAQCHEVWMRMASIGRGIDDEDRATQAGDLADQFDRVRSLADGEAQFLFGVIELYQTKVQHEDDRRDGAAGGHRRRRPSPSLQSRPSIGMNVIVNEETQFIQLIVVLAVMATISLMLLRWALPPGLVVMVTGLTPVP